MSQKVVQFDFTFQYPEKGHMAEANAVVVCEPSWEKRHVYRKMQAYLGDVAKAQAIIVAEMMAKRGPVQAQQTAPPTPSSNEPAVEFDLIEQVRMVLGSDGFPEFADYIQRELNNCKALAYVGNETGLKHADREPLTDQVWMGIANGPGGMAAIDKILSAFASFFLDPGSRTATTPPETTGESLPSASPAPPLERSRSRQR